jgi:hypothetical protein
LLPPVPVNQNCIIISKTAQKCNKNLDIFCNTNEEALSIRLMFEYEARFGRMSDTRSCWAPAPHRPVVNLTLTREFRYEYASINPWDGGLDFMTTEKINTENATRCGVLFLAFRIFQSNQFSLS